MKKFILHLLLLLCFPAFGQMKYTDAVPYGNRINFVTTEGTQIISGLTNQKQPVLRISRDSWFSWYKKDSIYITQGGFSGRLLNGDYQELFPNKALKVKGQHSQGKKTGTWRYWDISGTIRKEAEWKQGRENGVFKIYNDEGSLIQKGKMKDGVIHGILKVYSKHDSINTPVVKRYKRGKEVKKKSRLGIYMEQLLIKANSL